MTIDMRVKLKLRALKVYFCEISRNVSEDMYHTCLAQATGQLSLNMRLKTVDLNSDLGLNPLNAG